jgi:glycosyltransferase involved in cell wall biosynthesis
MNGRNGSYRRSNRCWPADELRPVNDNEEQKPMGDPKISVIMAAYNKSGHIREAIESILKQTMRDFELIVVDDVSTDDTVSIIKSIEDPRIVLILNDVNSGPAPTRNKAVAAARGEYLAIMDADDIALPERFQKETDFLDTHPEHGLVGGAFYVIDENGTRLQLVRVLTEDREIREGLQKQNWFGHSTVMIRRAIFNELGGYDTAFKYAHDYELMIRVAEKYKVANLNEPLCLWRSSPGNISNAKTGEQKQFAEKARISSLTRLSRKNTGVPIAIKEPPLVSVIVPTYNRPALIGRTLESILNQTYPHYEIVVVNDAGAPIEGIVTAMNAANNILYLRQKKNAGVAAARNAGIRAARGSHICYLDDDDVYYPDHIETLVNFLIAEMTQAAYTDSIHVRQKLINGQWETFGRKLFYSTDFDDDLILVRNLFPTLCLMHEKSCLDEAGMFDESLATHEDWDLWIRLSQVCTLHHIKKVTSEYLRREGANESMTSNPRSNFDRTRKAIYAKYRSRAAHRPDILRAQEMELAGIDPQQQKQALLVEQFKGFLSNISTLVEKGDFASALSTYDNHRKEYPVSIPEIAQVDALMLRVRGLQAKGVSATTT